MNYYKKNLKVLRQASPSLYRTLTSSLPAYPASTRFITENRNLLVKRNGAECYIHSLYQRDREYHYLFSAASPDAKVIILFGLGLGDALNYIKTHFLNLEHLIVIEPNLEAFKQFLSQQGILATIGSFTKISFIVNQSMPETASALNDLLSDALYRQPELVAAISYRTLYSEYYQFVQRSIAAFVRKVLVNLTTMRVSTSKWLTNSWRNIRHQNLPVEEIMNRIMPLPVIIVSAGPSLNKNIHLLKAAKNRALIIAVGSAITILDSHGIIPHFRMAFDGNEPNRLLFDGVDTSKCPLIYGDTLYHEILPLYSGEKLQMVMYNDYLTQYVRKRPKQQTILIRNGFSVANVAFELVCKWGCGKVILVGQDLCYTGNSMHAEGSWSDGVEIDKLRGLVKTKDIYGQDVLTTTAYLGMKSLFEEMIYGYRVDCINATEGGLPIAGSRNKTLQQVLNEELPELGDITARINKAIQQVKAGQRQTLESGHKFAAAVEADLEAIEAICSRRYALLKTVQALRKENNIDLALKELALLAQDSRQLMQLDYYKEVILPYIGDQLQAIRVSTEYTGSDPAQKVDSMLKCYVGETAEIEKMLSTSRRLLEEYKEAQFDLAKLAAYSQWLLA